jgi:hypothetical protein
VWIRLLSTVAILWVIPALMLCWVSVDMLGFIISSQLARLLSLSLVFLPPVYYSENALGTLSWISYIFPRQTPQALFEGIRDSIRFLLKALLCTGQS